MMVVHETLGELLFQEGGWWALEGSPSVAVISPSEYYKYDAADLVSLVMPAVPGRPCEVALEAQTSGGPATLMLGAGIDGATAKLFKPDNPGRFRFEVFKNDELVFDQQIEVHGELGFEDLIWRRPEGGGIVCQSGDKLRLRTEMLGPEVPAGMTFEPKMGFSGLRYDKSEELERQVASEEAPNIILIVEDTMRGDRSKQHGYRRDVVPHLDALAARGLEYTDAYSTASWTWPSTASILTGLEPDAHGVVSNDSCYLGSGVQTLAEVLQHRGYTTGAFARNPLIAPDKGFGQGFESFDVSSDHVKSGETLPKIEAWLDANAGRRFFLYTHLVDPHGPIEALESELQRLGIEGTGDMPIEEVHARLGAIKKKMYADGNFDLRAAFDEAFPRVGFEGVVEQYDACVASGDEYLGQILAKVEALGLTGKTIVVFTSDHGEEWLEHGMIRHSQGVHKELVHIPLVMAGPGIPAGASSERLVSNRHIADTLAYFGGGRMRDVEQPVNLAELGAGDPTPLVFFSTHHGFWHGKRNKKIYGVRTDKWALHLGQEEAEAGQASPLGWDLYDLEADPGELVDVSEQHPEVVAELRGKIEEMIAKELKLSERLIGGLRVGAAGATLEFLSRIGYLDGQEPEEK